MQRRRIWILVSLLATLLLACTRDMGGLLGLLQGVLEEGTAPAPGADMSVVALDIGQGDAILIISPDGRTMLVDGGNSSRDAEQVILPYLHEHGFERLDVMVLTHPDADHVGGLPTVLRSIPVGVVVSTGQLHTTQIYQEFLEEVRNARDRSGTQVIRGVAGADIPFDPAVSVEVVGPSMEAIEGEDKNNASIVLRISYGEFNVLLTGDAELEEEGWMLDQGYDLEAEVLKVSHHGSNTASGKDLLDAVNPEIALISVGANNQYGHPHREVLDRLRARGIEIYRTDLQGTIEVVTDGVEYWVYTER
jgi:competence protein ComEC